METYYNSHKTFIYLLLIFFAVFAGTGIFILMNSVQNIAPKKEEVVAVVEKKVDSTASMVATEGAFTISTAKTEVLLTDKELAFDVIVDSNGKNISGYDLVLNYDPIAFDFVSATSNSPDFKIYSYNRGSYISILGTKSIQTQQPSIFTQTKVATITFKPSKKGSFDFTLKSEIGKDKTDLITDKTEILNPALNQVRVGVK